jgi:MFS family permease
VPRLSRKTAFAVLFGTFTLLAFASSAPSPLYVVYQSQWDFSAITLTSVFAVYAIALLASLLVAGSLSDHIGRRPVLMLALVIEIVAMLLFAEARDVGWLFAARTLQGVATGMAMGALSAALLDLQPDDKPWRGALAGVVAPMTGIATGALATGLLVDYAPSPTTLVFWLLTGGFAVAVGLAMLVPESTNGDGRWRKSLKPRVGIPPSAQSAFVRSLPSLAATWALGGLILSIGPSLTAGVLGSRTHVAGGLPIFVMAGISAVASIRARRVSPRTIARAGLVALIIGIGMVVGALGLGSDALFLAGAAVCGLGFGPGFGGIFRSLTDLAPAERRGELVSAVLTASYLAFSLPAILAGVAVTQVGLRETAEVYGLALIALAGLALVLSGGLEDGRAASPAVVAGGYPVRAPGERTTARVARS